MSEAQFTVSLDASPLKAGVAQVIAEMNRLAGQVGNIRSPAGAGSTLMGGFTKELEGSFRNAETRMVAARGALERRLFEAPVGSTVGGTLGQSYSRIFRDAMNEAFSVAQSYQSRGVPIDFSKMVTLTGAEKLGQVMQSDLQRVAQTAKATAKSLDLRGVTGFGGFSPKVMASDYGTLERRLETLQARARATNEELGGFKGRAVYQDQLAGIKSVTSAIVDQRNAQTQLDRQTAKTVGSIIKEAERRPAGSTYGRGGTFGTLDELVRRQSAVRNQPASVTITDPGFDRLQQNARAGGREAYTQIASAQEVVLAKMREELGLAKSITAEERDRVNAVLGGAGVPVGDNRPALARGPIAPPLAGFDPAADSAARLQTARTGLTAAYTREARASLALTETGITQEAVMRRALDGIRGGGGGGGRGGGGRGGAVDPFDSFFGGLTSRGFDTGNKGFNLDTALTGLSGTAGTLVKYAALGSAIAVVTAGVGEGAREFLDYRDSLTDLASSLADTNDEFLSLKNSLVGGDLENDLQDLARAAGSNVGEQFDAAARAVRAFGVVSGPGANNNLELEGIADSAAKAATQLKVLTGTNINDQVGNVIAIGTAFGIAGDELERVADVVANARQNIGGDYAQISQGLANFAQPARTAGLTPQEAANLIAVVQARTDQSGQAVATRLSRITSISSGSTGQEVLRNAGVDTSQGLLQQFAQLQKNLQGFSEGRQKSIVSALGGTANIRELQVALENAQRVIRTSGSEYSKAGTAAELFNRKNADLAGTLRKIRGDLKNISIELANSGLFDFVAVGLAALEPFLRTVSDLLEAFNELPKPLRTVAAGVLEIAAAIALVNKLRASSAAHVVGETAAGAAAGAGAGAAGAAGANAANATAMTAAVEAELALIAVQKQETAMLLALLEAKSLVVGVRVEDALAAVAEAEATLANVVGTAREAEATALLALAKERLAGLQAQELELDALLNEQRLISTGLIDAETLALEANTIAREANAVADSVGNGDAAQGPSRLDRTKSGARSALSNPLVQMGALIAAFVAADTVFNALKDSSEATATAIEEQARATKNLGKAATGEALRQSEEALRAAAAEQRSAASGVTGGLANIIGGVDRNALASQLDKQADAVAKQRRALETSQADSRLSRGIFQDVESIDGLNAGLETLQNQGASATRVIDTLVGALGGVAAGSVPVGTVLPGQAGQLKVDLQATAISSLQKAFVGAITDSGRQERRNLNDIDAPNNRQRRDAGPRLFQNDTLDRVLTLDDTPLERFATPLQRSTVLQDTDLGQEAFFEAYQKDAEAVARFREDNRKARREVSKFFKLNNIGAQGGLLTEAQQHDLAERIAASYQLPGLEAGERRAARRRIESQVFQILQEKTDPGKALADPATSYLAQRTLVSEAERQAGESRLGDSSRIAEARNRLRDLREQAEIDTDSPRGGAKGQAAFDNKRKSALDRQIAAAEREVNLGSRPATAVEAARKKLATIQDVITLTLTRNADVSDATIQAEIQAKRDLEDALEEEAQAADSYAKARLGVDATLSASRIDLEAALREAALAASRGNPAEQYEALAKAAELQQQIIKDTAERNAAAALANVIPGDEVASAQAELDATKARLQGVTVREDDGSFTQAYLELIAQLKSDADALIQARASTSNARRESQTNPGSAAAQASTALINAQTTLNASTPGTSTYYQALTSLNQAKLDYARQEEDAIAARILARVPANDRLARSRAQLRIAIRRQRLENRVARGDYDTSGNLVGQAPDFKRLGKGIGAEFANGVDDFDYKQLGAEDVAGQLVSGITAYDYLSLGQAIGQDITDGVLNGVGVLISQLEIMTSSAASGGLRSPDAIDRAGRYGSASVPSGTYTGGYSSINTRQGQQVVPNATSITQQYGNRSSRYVGGVHKGVDIDAQTGDAVRAALGGKVVQAGSAGAYGNVVVIKASDGSLQRYGHLSKIGVSVGDKIGTGDRLGAVGSTGNSTGSHLHYEVTVNGRTVDPEKYLNGSLGKKGTGGGGKGGKTQEQAEADLAVIDAAAQVARDELDLKQSKIAARAKPNSSLSQARSQLKIAKLELDFYAKGTIEYYEALAAYREAQFALAQTLADRRSARRLANIYPGDEVSRAKADMRNARDQMKLAEKGTAEWYQAYASWKQAQADLTSAVIQAQKTRFLLNNDFTDPLVQAQAELRAARRKLALDTKRGAPKRVIESDKLSVEQAEAAKEQTAFDERLKATQTAERLGRISHQAYIEYLNGEKSRLEAITNRTYQQQQQLDQIDLLLKDASEQAQGMWNIGDIQLPTPYEVRRFMKASAAGLQYQAGQAASGGFGPSPSTTNNQVSSSTVQIDIDGADTGFILKVLTQYLGTTAVSRTSSATRKA